MQTDIVIVGGGLAGLSVAHKLQAKGRDFVLFEARDRFGGRIKVCDVSSDIDERVDLGPAWFWPGQPRMALLADQLNIQVFEQYSKGNTVLHNADGSVRRDLAFSTMAGSLRLVGGMARLTERLSEALPSERIHLNHTVTSVAKESKGLRVEVFAADETRLIDCNQIVLALPPRLVEASMLFKPPLSDAQTMAMRTIPTWMAGHAKVLAIYDRPFWRDIGLSGDGMSRRGPMVEIHDASPQSEKIGALFGFVGVPAERRRGHEAALIEACVDQLTAMFGPAAANPTNVILQDWAVETLTATPDDARGPDHHPVYGMPRDIANIWDGRVLLASTEVGNSYGGFLEGALEAAEAALEKLT